MQYFESPAYAEWSKRIYGDDLKQMGMVTMKELKLFYRETAVPFDSDILDMGCGPGYITAAIAEHFKSRVLGIDNDEESIKYAKKTFHDNPSLSFKLMDYNDVSFGESTFELIYFFDTLYFTFSIEKLRILLDKCLIMLKPGGHLSIFWSNHPKMYEMIEPGASNTQVGIWGNDNKNNLKVKSFDLTEEHRKFWPSAYNEGIAMENELRSEIGEVYDELMKERTYFSKLCEEGEAGGIYRWLYIFTKNSDIK